MDLMPCRFIFFFKKNTVISLLVNRWLLILVLIIFGQSIAPVFASPEGSPGTSIAKATFQGDIEYSQNPEQKLDVYFSQTVATLPVVIFVHGGGWQIGDKDHHRDKGQFLVKNGFVCVIPEYRLAPKWKHPAQVQDIAAAVAWVVTNARRFGGDPEKIVLIGHSSGAHLTALVSTNQRFLGEVSVDSARLKGVVLLDTEFFDLAAELKTTTKARRRKMIVDAFGTDPATLQDASPMEHIDQGKTLPCFHILQAGARGNRGVNSRNFHETLKKNGHKADFIQIPGKNHRDMHKDMVIQGDPVSDEVLKFIRVATE
ncbi:MAG: alpha/beta hydrolase [Candidatus Riflebacteria bacterium]